MASKADVSIEKEYVVRNKNVFLALTIGEGQFGTSDVFLEDARVLRASGPVKVLLGGGSDIAGKTVIVRSVVNDVSSATNRMSVTYRLTGGAAAEEFIARGKVVNAGDLLIFEATFTLATA
jgi:hypothetical protein